jgi:3-deoxy-D-manno-octulosonic-acid transferase
MMESSALGNATFGPHTFNFKQTVDALLEGNGAIVVADSHELFDITKNASITPLLPRRPLLLPAENHP